MKKKTLIKLFLTSSICLICLTGCNKEVEPVTSELVSESIEVVSEDTSIEDTSIEETVSEETDVTSEVESVDTSEEVIEAVPENVTTNTEATEVVTVDKKVKYISGMPTTDAEKYNKYIASTEQSTTSETGDPTVTPKQNGQKTETKKKVVKEEKVEPTIIDVTNPVAEAELTNVSQEMTNLLNAKRGELGFPQTVEVIPESDVAIHNAMKQGTINLYTIEFSHEALGDVPGISLAGTNIGKSGIKDSANMFNGWMNSPGHYDTIMPTDNNHLHPEQILQVVCYVYGPCEGYYYYNLSYRIKSKEVVKEDWQLPYIDENNTNPEVKAEEQTGVVDNYGDEIILDMLIGTNEFWGFFDSCSPELQEHYRQKHPELFN